MAGTYMKRTCDGAYSSTWTWSAWVKRSATGSYHGLFCNKKNDSNSNSRVRFYFSNADRLAMEVKDSTSGDDSFFQTNKLFRDVNAWYHIVLAYDTTQSAENDRIKLWVNNEEVTSWEQFNRAGSGFGTLWSSAMEHRIGTQNDNSNTNYYFNGLMSHVHLTYGTAYTPSAFGQYDANGVWTIKTSPSVTYGSQGYFVLKDSGSKTDQSGNGNNFSEEGTPGIVSDTQDSPSNVFATGNTLIGRHSNGNYLQPDWSNGNLTATAHGSAWRIFKSTLAASSGKYYAEFKWVSDSNTRYAYVGIYDEDNYANKVSGYPYMGDMANCHAYYSENGQYYGQGNGNSVSFGSAFSSTGDGIVGVAMDLDNSKVYFSSNGSWQGSGDPSNGTGGKSITANKLYSFALQLYSVGSIVYSANFGNGYFGTTAVSSAGTNASGIGIFEYDVPTGYTALSTKGLNE